MLMQLLLSLICECTSCEEPAPPVGCIEEFGGGNVWKPEGDETGSIYGGKLVVILKESYPDFDYCEVKRRNESWERMTYTGRANGNRQHYRGASPGGPAYAGKNKDGGVRCFKPGGQLCFWPIPGAPKNRWD